MPSEPGIIRVLEVVFVHGPRRHFRCIHRIRSPPGRRCLTSRIWCRRAGLVPVLELAEQTGLSRLIDEHVDAAVDAGEVRGGQPGRQADLDRRPRWPAGRTASMMRACCARAAHRGCSTRCMPRRRWGSSCASSPSGTVKQLAAVARAHLVALAARTPLLAGASKQRMFLDIDSLLRPVYGQGQAGRLVRARQDRQPRAAAAGPVPADHHHLHGQCRAGDRRGAAAQRQGWLRPWRPPAKLKQAITTAKAINPDATIMVRGDSMFGTKKVITTCVAEGVRVLLVGEPQQTHQRRDRGHRRSHLHPGALPGRGRRPRHRPADL